MIDENDMKYKLHGPEAKFCWNTAIPICFGIVCACFQTELLEQRWQSRKHLLSGPLRKKSANPSLSVPIACFITCYP